MTESNKEKILLLPAPSMSPYLSYGSVKAVGTGRRVELCYVSSHSDIYLNGRYLSYLRSADAGVLLVASLPAMI